MLIGLWGVGGFGREVMPLLEAQEYGSDSELVFVVDGHSSVTSWCGLRVLSDVEYFSYKGDRCFNVAIADSRTREKITKRAIEAGCKPHGICAKDVGIHKSNKVGDGVILCSHVSVTADATIGRFFHANIYSYIAHDCVIGDFVTFAPRVSCNGHVVVGNHAYIGTAAIIKNGTADNPIVIGEGAIVGMGAVVTKSVPPFTTVIGNPARPK